MDIKNINRDVYVQTEHTENQAKVNSPTSSAAQGTAQPQADRVSVSEEGVLRTEAYRTAMNTSDVRQDKINAIKDRISTGTYEINPHRIASNLLTEDADLWS